jgi:hypothetical protein
MRAYGELLSATAKTVDRFAQILTDGRRGLRPGRYLAVG